MNARENTSYLKLSQLESLSKMAKNGNLGNPEINAWKKPFKRD